MKTIAIGRDPFSTRIPRTPHCGTRMRATMRCLWRGLHGVFWLAVMMLSMQQAVAGQPLVLTNGTPRFGTIGLLLPDGMAVTNPLVMAWLDAAEEEGLRIEALSDAQFLQLGARSNAYRGMIFPDQLHVSATDVLITAVQNYVSRGGKAMLVYDFGVLTSAGVYPVPKSRLSNLAGVDYALYDELRDRTSGLGPLTGFVSKLRQLQVPPGKSMAFVTTPTTITAVTTTTDAVASILSLRAATATATVPPPHKIAATKTGVLKKALLEPNEALFLRVMPSNPGGLSGYDHAQQFRSSPYDAHLLVHHGKPTFGGKLPEPKPIKFDATHKDINIEHTTEPENVKVGRLFANALALAPSPDPVHAISGYLYGELIYPSYVTRGVFAGTQLLSAPHFGLAAGISNFGSGQTLFVNTPLTYLKGRSDGMLMHGMLHYFGNTMLSMPHLSTMPNARAGLTLNWHLCSNFAVDMATLTNLGVFNNGPFSIHITAGPDTVTVGDHLGWNLPNNPTAQQMLRSLDQQGHQIGNHGGWIHDYYGTNVSETDQATFQQYLELNHNAVAAVLGHDVMEYAGPQGNSPSWSNDWIEQHNAIGTYSLSHTGLGTTRNYANGASHNPGLRMAPIMPLGLYATTEEFIAFNIPKSDVSAWYQSLIDFAIQHRVNRLIYLHPIGAAQWSDVLLTMLNYAKTKQSAGSFAWYTIADMAWFMDFRNEVNWSESLASNGLHQFSATHPDSLEAISWMLPKAAFVKPVVTSGMATVSDGGDGNWLVIGGNVKALNFSAAPL